MESRQVEDVGALTSLTWDAIRVDKLLQAGNGTAVVCFCVSFTHVIPALVGLVHLAGFGSNRKPWIASAQVSVSIESWSFFFLCSDQKVNISTFLTLI